MRTGQTPVARHPAAPIARPVAKIRLLPCGALSAWDAVIACTLSPGDRVLVIGSGPIPTLWAASAARAGLAVEIMATPTEAGLARHLGADRFGAIKAVFVALAEDGARLAPAAVRRTLDQSFHEAVLLVDASTTTQHDLPACFADIVVTDPDAGLARSAPHRAIAAE